MVALVVAFSENRVIGRDGDLPWRLPSDLRRFKELTMGGTVVMGRRTFESLPAAVRPLPGRRNLVLSATPGFAAPGAEVLPTLAAALEACDRDCFVIGGARTYEEALPLADVVYATEVEGDVEGDTFFPPLGEDWALRREERPVTEGGHTFAYRTYERAV